MPSSNSQVSTILLWSNLLACEQVASEILNNVLQIATVSSEIYQHDGPDFLEITRFDRHGEHGCSPRLYLIQLNAALAGKHADWLHTAHVLQTLGWLCEDNVVRITLT